MRPADVVIVGAGHGGAQAAGSLRQQMFDGSILMLGDEPDYPYERPPLSKEYPATDKPFERLLIRPAAFWAERRIEVRRNERVVAVDPAAHRVRTRAGEEIGYGHLIWATGGAPRRLTCDGHDLRGAHTVRNRADVDRMADVFAIGDCARHANRFAAGAQVRLESVQNANDHATVATRTIVGEAASYDAVPWFWSNQYDLKLQTVGLSTGHDAAIVRGDPASRGFSIVYLQRSRVIALDCVNAVRDYVQGKRLVTEGMIVDPARLADAGVPLKAM